MSTLRTHIEQIKADHTFLAPHGYPNGDTGTCRCGHLPVVTTRSEHARHIERMALEAAENHARRVLKELSA